MLAWLQQADISKAEWMLLISSQMLSCWRPLFFCMKALGFKFAIPILPDGQASTGADLGFLCTLYMAVVFAAILRALYRAGAEFDEMLVGVGSGKLSQLVCTLPCSCLCQCLLITRFAPADYSSTATALSHRAPLTVCCLVCSKGAGAVCRSQSASALHRFHR